MTIKNIGILHGAILNGGDYLICKRGTKLLNKYLDSKVNFIHIKRWESFDGNFDALIILGGPIVSREMHPQSKKIKEYLNNKDIPVIALGIGISGEKYDGINNYFTEESLEFWKRIYDTSNLISVRDKLTYSLLNKLDIGAKLTGCPALFDLDIINNKKTDHSLDNVNKYKISFTIPNIFLSLNLKFTIGQIINLFLSTFFISYMKLHFKLNKINTEYYLILQHGSNPLTNIISLYCKILGIKAIDASKRSLDEIKEISCSNIHIGTRLHSHILFLSSKRLSYLFNVDCRTKAFLDTFNDNHINFSFHGIIKLLNTVSKELKNSEKANIRIKKSEIIIQNYYKEMDHFLIYLEQFLDQ